MWQSDFQWASSNKFIAYPFVEDSLYAQDSAVVKAIKHLFTDIYVRYPGSGYQNVYLEQLLVSADTSSSPSTYPIRIKLVLQDSSVLLDTVAVELVPEVYAFGPWTVFVWNQEQLLVSCTVRTEDLTEAEFNFTSLQIQPSCISCVQSLIGIKVNDVLLTGDITLEPHYSMTGAIKGSNLTLTCTPGGGDGFPPREDCDCFPEGSSDSPLTYIKAINNCRPASNGNLSLQGDDCLSVRIPLDPSSDLLSHDLRAHSLRVVGDCSACCTCEDYVDKYNTIRAVWERIYALRARVQTLIDNFNTLKEQLAARCAQVEVCRTTITATPKPGWLVSLKGAANFGTGANSLTGPVIIELSLPGAPTYTIVPGSCYVFTPDVGRRKADNETLEQRLVQPVVGSVASLDCQLYFTDVSRNIVTPIEAVVTVTANGVLVSQSTTTFSLLSSFNKE
jgi:hypothetical protein